MSKFSRTQPTEAPWSEVTGIFYKFLAYSPVSPRSPLYMFMLMLMLTLISKEVTSVLPTFHSLTASKSIYGTM